MASIAAWQQVVPARLEDVQVPPHGRWRSDVEGSVRHVELDTRSIDQTDTTATPTDPRSPASTITVTAEASDCSPVVEDAPLTVRTMTKTYPP